VSELHEQLIELQAAEVIFLRQQLAEEIEERDAAEMRSVAHLKMYTEASQQLAELTKERDEAVAMAKELTTLAPITDADLLWAEAKLAAQKHQEGLP